jgi:hypothetical protein
LSSTGAMSVGEIFRKMTDHISEIDKRVLELRTLDARASPAPSDAALAYMKQSQDVIRKEAALLQKRLDTISKVEWISTILGAVDRNSLASINYALDRVAKARDEAHRAYTSFGTVLP